MNVDMKKLNHNYILSVKNVDMLHTHMIVWILFLLKLKSVNTNFYECSSTSGGVCLLFDKGCLSPLYMFVMHVNF